jgi:hypothetical protein
MQLKWYLYKWSAIFFLATLLMACGGGGGGGGEGENNTSQALHYTGSTEQATLALGNSQALAIGSYSGGSVGSFNISSSLAQNTESSIDVGAYHRQRLLDAIKNSAQQVDYISASRNSSAVSAALQTDTLHGPCGGSLEVSMDVNESTGNFSGTFSYSGYCDSGVTMTGDGRFEGVYDLDQDQLRQFRMSFASISVTEPDSAYKLSGWVEVSYNADGFETGMDLLMQDSGNGKIYWLSDYAITATRMGSYTNVTLSGRYYDPEYGYVDLRTDAPVRFGDSGDAWPLQGVLIVTGSDGARIRMSFNEAGYCRLEADFNGDDEVDWLVDCWFATDPGNSAPVANAGLDRTAAPSTLVTLDGSASYDPDDDTISHSWSFVSCPSTECPALDTPSDPTSSFTPVATGQYVLQLVVNDGHLDSTPDRVVIDVAQGVSTGSGSYSYSIGPQ